MAGFPDTVEQHFPLQDIESVVKLFRAQLTGDSQPDLALMSLVLGMIENSLTCNRSLGPQSQPSAVGVQRIFPVIELTNVEALYLKFVTQIKGSVDKSECKSGYATRDFVKKVSDVIWSSLSRSYYKDKAHLQSLYSFLTGNKLDCFGVAFAVVAACQVLAFHDVHLSLSEDHAWVVFGENQNETAEVTWHGKGNEDKRGQPITMGVAEKAWLYLNGHAVVCNREMEVAAIVSGINPSINATTDSTELASLQQELLWLLYDLGFLEKYPMALGNLADLEEIEGGADRTESNEIFKQAIHASKKHYNNQHVYPYTYFGGHLYRKKCYKQALEHWAEAANVIRRYNYNREDEEIYKEFLEIAHELIPNMLKTASLSKCLQEKTILCDPQCFAYVLQFYDGICQWEEGSCTPVLHIGWAKHFITCIAKFSPRVREYLHIKTNDEETMDMEDKSECTTNGDGNKDQSTEKGLAQDVKASRKDDKKEESNIAAIAGSDCEVPSELLDTVTTTTATPFTTTSTWDAKTDFYDFLSSQSNGSAFPGMTMESVMKAESPAEMVLHRQSRSGPHSVASDEGGVTCRDALPVMIPTNITFTSAKMKGLKDLLTSHGKVNTSAIQLQLTAQSQTTVVKRSRSATEYDYVSQRRRPRRE